jgi:hypothetical protein
MWNDCSTQRFYSLFPIFILFLSPSALLLTTVPPSTMPTTAFRNFQQARKDELELDSLLDDDDEDEWFDKLHETQTPFAFFLISSVANERPNCFQPTHSNPLEGDAESVPTLYTAYDLPDLDGEEGGATPTIGRPASAEDSRESSAQSAT